MAKQAEKIDEIQYLRGIAAFAVFLSHIADVQSILFRKYPPVAPAFVGYWGVDIFFIVSGFIMVYITAATGRGAAPASVFLRNRVTRIVPAYWLFTVVAFFLFQVGHEVFHKIKLFSISDLISSLLFVKIDGFPVLVVGWTLNYEMFFYLLFALVLLLCAPSLRVLVLLIVLLLLVVSRLLLPTGGPAWTFVTHPLLLEFAAGVAIGWLVTRRECRHPFLGWLAMSTGALILLLACVTIDAPTLVEMRVFYWGLPAMLVVWGVLNITLPRIAWLSWLGDISYSLYLCHGPVVFCLAMACRRWLPPDWNPNAVIAVLAIPLVLLVASASHRLIEMRVQRVWYAL